jgi:hypothetical protein
LADLTATGTYQSDFKPTKHKHGRLTSREIDEEYDHEQRLARELAQQEMERQRVQI